MRSLVLAFLILAWNTTSSAEQPKVSGFFVIPHGKSGIAANGQALICINISNESAEPLLLNSLRVKGVEQTAETPMPRRGPAHIPCYLDTFRVEFQTSDGKVASTEEVYCPAVLELAAQQSASILLQVKTPQAPGRYKVVITGVSDEKYGGFGSGSGKPASPKKIITCKDLGTFTLPDIHTWAKTQ